ncbi:MAG: hypothetical protein ACXW05_21010, partial [Gemmatirosa sp.]
MSAPTLALLALLQQPAAGQPATPSAAPSPVARIVVSPADPVVAAMDTLRLTARALDAQGNPVPNVRLRFQAAGGWFE